MINWRSKEMKDKLEQFGLEGKKHIAKGRHSRIYPDHFDPSMVVKVSEDLTWLGLMRNIPHSYQPSFPLLDDGTIRIGDIYSVRVERLDKLVRATDPYREVAQTIKRMDGIKWEVSMAVRHDILALVRLYSRTYDLPRWTLDALGGLHSYLIQCTPEGRRLALDLHMANFMLRPGTGEIVFIDPIMDRLL